MHRQGKAFVGAFQRLNDVVPRVARRDAEMASHHRRSLMMARIHSYHVLAEDFGQVGLLFDCCLMRGLALILGPPDVVVGRVQMLDQRPAVGDVEDLKTAADTE